MAEGISIARKNPIIHSFPKNTPFVQKIIFAIKIKVLSFLKVTFIQPWPMGGLFSDL